MWKPIRARIAVKYGAADARPTTSYDVHPDTAAQGRGACVSSICRYVSDEEKKRHRPGTGRR
jgi:hypothetical protein